MFISLISTVYAQDLGPGPAGVEQLQQLVQRVINMSVGLAFVVLTIMLVVGGIKFITSGGDQKAVQGAWGTITWALLGILFLVLTWLILLLIETFTGVPVTKFCIGFPGGPNSCDALFN